MLFRSKDIEDLAVVYRFLVGDNLEQPIGSVLVTNKMLEKYGITPEQLHEDAVKFAPEIRPLVIEGMMEVLRKQMGVDKFADIGFNIPPEQEYMFVASVEGSFHGAGVLAYQDFMDKASERVKAAGEPSGDFFILPSSIHEIIIIPDNGLFDLSRLESFVREVNATSVDISEQLSDNVYHYDSKDKIFELGDKFFARQNDREKAAEKSVLKQLKDNKADIAKQSKTDAPLKGANIKDDKAL